MTYDQQLHRILQATGWSQEELAGQLQVSFATLNSWVNKRSKPRAKSLTAIDKLYLSIIGVDAADPKTVSNQKNIALRLHVDTYKLIKDRDAIDKLTLHLTYHTNTIEGSTMTLADVEDVLFEDRVLTSHSAIEQAEARNHQATLHWLIGEVVNQDKDFAINVDFIRNINLRLMNGITVDPGQFRRHAVGIQGVHVPLANWQKIPELIDKLVKDTDDNTKKLDAVSLFAYTHAQFEKIHPFSDGNGRTGRLLMLAQALQLGYIPPIVTKERKYAYYKYLELAQVRDDYLPLEQFIAESMQFTNDLLSG
ncbi:MAG: Fic family protein [Candidatus Saccharimonadales bacterium]